MERVKGVGWGEPQTFQGPPSSLTAQQALPSRGQFPGEVWLWGEPWAQGEWWAAAPGIRGAIGLHPDCEGWAPFTYNIGCLCPTMWCCLNSQTYISMEIREWLFLRIPGSFGVSKIFCIFFSFKPGLDVFSWFFTFRGRIIEIFPQLLRGVLNSPTVIWVCQSLCVASFTPFINISCLCCWVHISTCLLEFPGYSFCDDNVSLCIPSLLHWGASPGQCRRGSEEVRPGEMPGGEAQLPCWQHLPSSTESTALRWARFCSLAQGLLRKGCKKRLSLSACSLLAPSYP